MRYQLFGIGLGTLLAVGCSSNTTTPPATDGGGATDSGGAGLVITISAPTADAKDVSVSAPVLKATFNRAVTDPDKLTVVLEKDGKLYYGLKKYSATNHELIFTPFTTLQSRSTYTFKVAAEGIEAKVSFTTEKANEGALPAAAGKSYDFRIKTITYPSELAGVFNSQLKTAPPVLMHVVSLKETTVKDGNTFGSILIAGSTGKVGEPLGQAKVLVEDATHTSTTAMAIQGTTEGTWLGAGPSDLHLTASGVPLVIREFFVSGLISTDGTTLSNLRLVGLIDPEELGKAVNVDLGFICADARFSKFCDAQKRIRVAAEVESAPNPIAFTTFITKPVNAANDVEPNAVVQVHFSEPVNAGETKVGLKDAAGKEVPGKTAVEGKSGTFTPDAPLAAKTKYTVEATGVSVDGKKDVRHLTFTTK
ncbi:MAG: Ig-like domain-containing protein [Deltaproteobacteria bacterium]|nr:Ig-like domain-containing protein [Deltaproteobacteria bacterium]